MTYFDREINGLQKELAEIQQSISDWHHADVLLVEIVEFVQASLPLFQKLQATTELEAAVLKVFADAKEDADRDRLVAQVGNGEEHSPIDSTRNKAEAFRYKCPPSQYPHKLENLLAYVRPIRIRFATIFGFEEFQCTPNFIKKYLQNLSASIPDLDANRLERVGVFQFWNTVDDYLSRCERYKVEQMEKGLGS